MSIGSKTAVMALVILSAVVSPVKADEMDGLRGQLDKVLAVLRVRSQTASKSCLNAMSQVHATEQQVKDHENDTGSHPDLDIARDVLESDYQNSSQICGVDADRACRESPGTDLAKQCLALHHDPG